MHNDDVMVGRLLTRRELVALLGMSSVAAMAEPLAGQAPGTAMPGCVVQPEQTEGPYFVDKMLNRQDVRLDPVTKATQAGLPLRLTFNVSQVTGEGKCAPLPGAQVDLWQCDAAGVYSGVKDPLFNTVGQNFPPRLSGDRRARNGKLRHDLSGLVSGPCRPRPFQDPHLTRSGEGIRVHLAAVF